jgi:hypothetical protein
VPLCDGAMKTMVKVEQEVLVNGSLIQEQSNGQPATGPSAASPVPVMVKLKVTPSVGVAAVEGRSRV